MAAATEILTTPTMHWLFDRGQKIDRFCQSVVLRAPLTITRDQVIDLLMHIARKHTMLSTRLCGDEQAKKLVHDEAYECKSEIEQRVKSVDIQSPEEEFSGILKRALDDAEKSICPRQGLMYQVVLMGPVNGSFRRLIFTAHHLVVDAVSWGTIIKDLEEAWNKILARKQLKSEARDFTFRTWTNEIAQKANDPSVLCDLTRWTNILGQDNTFPEDIQLCPRVDTEATRKRLKTQLNESDTRALLHQAAHAYKCSVEELMVAALCLSFLRWKMTNFKEQSDGILLNVEAHGRENDWGIDTFEGVGWFTTLFPIRVTLRGVNIERLFNEGFDKTRALRMVQESLKEGKKCSVNYGILRYMNQNTKEILSKCERASPPAMCFNYFGRHSSQDKERDWSFDLEYEHQPTFEEGLRLPHAIELNTIITQDSRGTILTADWSSASRVVSEASLHLLADYWQSAIKLYLTDDVIHAAGFVNKAGPVSLTMSASDMEKIKKKMKENST
jgi:non-ribosomal peptide synthase protein (TIGR01720 family)